MYDFIWAYSAWNKLFSSILLFEGHSNYKLNVDTSYFASYMFSVGNTSLGVMS